ncbi:MAG: TPR end-of-group domain-containing protein [Myxococcaceae bacterium]
MRHALIAAPLLLAACTSPKPQSPPVQSAAALNQPGPDAGITLSAEAQAKLLRTQAQTAYRQHDYGKCVDLHEQAKPLAAESASDAYNEACCAALAGDSTRAFDELNVATSKGYRNVSHLQTDPDLNALKVKADSRWPSVVAKAQANLDEWAKSNNLELQQIYDADQADRTGDALKLDWKVTSSNDEKRRARVKEILAAGGAKSSADYYNAAMVFQHGREVADFELSHQLCLKALELDPTNKQARWLAAASEDRALMNKGLPQKWGTQFRAGEDGKWQLYQVDPSITDEERAKWEVPPLAEAKRRAEAMNQKH